MTTSDQLVVVSDFSAGAYLFLFHAREEIPRSKIEVPFLDRSQRVRRAMTLARADRVLTHHGQIRAAVLTAVSDRWERAHEIRPRVGWPMRNGMLSTVLYQLAKAGLLERDDRAVYGVHGFCSLKPFYRTRATGRPPMLSPHTTETTNTSLAIASAAW